MFWPLRLLLVAALISSFSHQRCHAVDWADATWRRGSDGFLYLLQMVSAPPHPPSPDPVHFKGCELSSI